MVLGDLLKNISNALGLNKEDHRDYGLKSRSIDFPQGAKYLDYRQDKNITGISHMAMSNTTDNPESRTKYINSVHSKKTQYEKTANKGMAKNLALIESYTNSRNCVDRDYEYYRNLSKDMREKQMTEDKVHYCLTGIDTHLVESDAIDVNNLSYNTHLRSIVNNSRPWELNDIHDKILPDNLSGMNIISEREKNCLNN